MKKDKVLVLLNTSMGELHVLLPILKLIKDTIPNCETYVVFLRKTLLEDAKRDEIYFSILQSAATILPRKSLLPFLLKNHLSVKLIFKDYLPLQEKTIPAYIKDVCVNAKTILFPHAFALYDHEAEGKQFFEATDTRYSNRLIDYLFVNAKFDVFQWSKKIQAHKIISIGALGYSSWWRSQMIQFSDSAEFNKLKQKAGNRKVVLFTLRAPHRIYLTREDFDYLLKTGAEEIFKIPDVFVIIKPHPRQRIKELKEFFQQYPADKYEITGINTFSLSLLAEFTVSFWSSSITDSLAMGIPNIEYYRRFSEDFPQSYINEQNIRASFYTKLGFAIETLNQEQLSAAIGKMLLQYDDIKKAQEAQFDKVFFERETSKDFIVKFLHENIFNKENNPVKVSIKNRLENFYGIMVWSLKRLVKADDEKE